MAFRIRFHVTRGELDNRERGRVVGRIWLKGMDEPLELDLKGNMCADIAGCLLTFHHTAETHEIPASHAPFREQAGTAGDMTASRKVRVPDLPMPEYYEACKRGEKPPEHMGNCLYLEWYSERNGRIVLETTDFECTVSEPAWLMTPEEEADRATEAAKGFGDFLGKLSEAVDKARSKTPWDKVEWDEFDHERLLRESDARADKYAELLDKYGDSDDMQDIIRKEMGWDCDDGEETDPEWAAERAEIFRAIDEASAAGELEEPAPDPATEGVDWIRTEDGDLRHPLQHRVFEGAMEFWHKVDALADEVSGDGDLQSLVFNYQTTGVKLAGALNGLAHGRSGEEFGHVIARMKRALAFLHEAQAAHSRVVEKGLLAEEDSAKLIGELFAVRGEILALMEEFRKRS
jgi:hypothetical protein